MGRGQCAVPSSHDAIEEQGPQQQGGKDAEAARWQAEGEERKRITVKEFGLLSEEAL